MHLVSAVVLIMTKGNILYCYSAQSAVAVEYYDCGSAEG